MLCIRRLQGLGLRVLVRFPNPMWELLKTVPVVISLGSAGHRYLDLGSRFEEHPQTRTKKPVKHLFYIRFGSCWSQLVKDYKDTLSPWHTKNSGGDTLQPQLVQFEPLNGKSDVTPGALGLTGFSREWLNILYRDYVGIIFPCSLIKSH